MAAFGENFDLDALRQIYDIRAVNSLAKFLLPGHSLCIIHHPEWREFREREFITTSKGGIACGCVRLVVVKGHNGQGEPDELLLGICGPDDQGYYRHKLDVNLKSTFLFATWKRGAHGFRLIQARQTIACFLGFEEALAAYLPDGFTPEYSMESRPLDGEPVFDPDSFYIGDGGIG